MAGCLDDYIELAREQFRERGKDGESPRRAGRKLANLFRSREHADEPRDLPAQLKTADDLVRDGAVTDDPDARRTLPQRMFAHGSCFLATGCSRVFLTVSL